jgi:ribosome-binding protein aMBF1 (putative translation factor)
MARRPNAGQSTAARSGVSAVLAGTTGDGTVTTTRCPFCGANLATASPREIVGQRIRRARLGKGLTQGELGRLLARPRSHAAISELEAGKVRINIDDISNVAKVLDVSVLTILEGITM